MLEISPEKIAHVIIRAREYDSGVNAWAHSGYRKGHGTQTELSEFIASLNEILLPENFKFAGQAVKDIPMPGDVILVCITRDAEFIIPHGNTTLLPWDRILCLTQDDTLHLLMDAWGLSGK